MNANAMKRVLVVDDDPVVGKSFDRVLAPKGYAVISAAGGAEALERLAREDYDLVYTDIRMPGLDGIEVARQIRATRPWLPVVIVTGYGTEDNEKQAHALGVSAFVHKPLSPELIESTTAAWVTAPMPAPAPAAAPEAAGARGPKGFVLFARNVGFFLLAPVVSLVYVTIGPIVGIGLLAYMAIRKAFARG